MGYSLRLVLSLAFVLSLMAPRLLAQEPDSCSAPLACLESTEAASPAAQQNSPPAESPTSSSPDNSAQPLTKPGGHNLVDLGPNLQQVPLVPGQQPKRILGIISNFRVVSAGATPPPPTLKESFMIATRNSFDYSALLFVGITSSLAEATNAHPPLGDGIGGFGRYYWRGWVDKTDGNYWVIFALPTLFHQDERYYALGHGGAWKRLAYSASRIFITPSYHGHNSFNVSELLGRGIAQGVSLTYYPSQTRTPGTIARKYGFDIGRDALTNIFQEFWPDIAAHVLHRHP